MKYVSAKWIKIDVEGYSDMIKAIGDDGVEYIVPDKKTDVAPWPQFLADGGVIEPADEPVIPVPSTISDRQFFQQLAIAGLITQDEALAAVQTGSLPAAFVTFIDQLPAAKRFDAKMKLTGATTFERSNPLTDAFGAMYGMNSEQIDELWRVASQL